MYNDKFNNLSILNTMAMPGSQQKKQKTNDSLAKELSEKACSAIDNLSGELHELSNKLWANPELKFEEHFAHETVTTFFEKHGFDVRRKYPLETAFVASNKTTQQGNGPCVAVLCEYDALPKIGHACGHNLIAEAGSAAAIGILKLIVVLYFFASATRRVKFHCVFRLAQEKWQDLMIFSTA
jgi:metal-dependent amidase/aminoacylase/carboxypeptidase family protein